MFQSINKAMYGILFIAVIAYLSLYIAQLSLVKESHISVLLIGVILGAILSPVFSRNKKVLEAGVTFCTKKLLRFGIVLYGFNITFLEIAKVGLSGFCIAMLLWVLSLFWESFWKLRFLVWIRRCLYWFLVGVLFVVRRQSWHWNQA